MVTSNTFPKAVTLTWVTIPGKQYTVQYSPDLSLENWLPLDSFTGNGNETEVGFPISGQEAVRPDKLFWRVAVKDIDTDGDGFTDYEEFQKGSDPLVADRDGDGLTDAWEIENGLDPDDDGSINPNNGSAGDADGDGVPNIDEQNGGTNPNNANDFPIQIIVIRKSADGSSNNVAYPEAPVFRARHEWGSGWGSYGHHQDSSHDKVTPAVMGDYMELQGMAFPATPPDPVAQFRSNLGGDTRSTSRGAILNSGTPNEGVSISMEYARVWVKAPASASTQTFHFVKIKEKTTYVQSPPTGPSHSPTVETLSSELVDLVIDPTQTLSNSADLKPDPILQEQPVVASVSTTERLVTVMIEPDDNMSGVIGDVVKSANPDSEIKHFVTPKANPPPVGPPVPIDQPYVVLKAAYIASELITKGNINQVFEWEGGEPYPGDPLKRWVARDATGTGPAKVKIKMKQGGAVAAEMHVWVVWTTIEPTIGKASFDINAIASNYWVPPIPGFAWKFKFVIQPASIVSGIDDRPDFAGDGHKKPVPGAGKLFSTDPTKGHGDSANYKWDTSRQMSISIGNEGLINKEDLALGYPQAWVINQPVAFDNPVPFPTEPAEGNDDPNTGGEDCNPYQACTDSILAHSVGEMCSYDAPSCGASNTWGENGKGLSVKFNYYEFARLEIWDGKRSSGRYWYRISDGLEWHHVFSAKFTSPPPKWSDNNSSAKLGLAHP